ncbi:MAG: L,D-transpeptidase family protein [Prevotella sp.]|jgi:murein L,D-transpeptidase YcbB/YkuD|nr:L,D-transpeptidase family protein [Prevotella sp.]
MGKILLASFCLLSIVAFVSCKQRESTTLSDSDKKEVVRSKFAKTYPDYSPKRYEEVVYDLIQKDSLLLPFYAENEYATVWSHDTLDTQRLQGLIHILNNSREHGLSGYFPTAQITSLTDSIDSGLFKDSLEYLYKKMADLELLSTQTAVKYVTGMSYGFTDPKKLYKKDYDISVLMPDSTFYSNLYKGLRENPLDIVANALPSDPVYQALLDEYRSLEQKKQETPLNKITGTATYKLGDKNEHISAIARRLMLTGEYTPTIDSTANDSLHNTLNKELLAAINTFRRKNSYPEEESVGKLTIDALNRPLDYYQTKLWANMERYRWKRAKSKHDKHIEVNVASMSLVASQKNDSLPLTMRICVGKVTNKTPLLQSDIHYLNLNPVWNVPTSIAQKEVAVLQKKDPTYIKRHNMKLYKGGKEVDITTINWKEVNPSKFSYTIRQNPGEGNSLGLIKFMFNNAFSVYLHDTPTKSAFARKDRAVSHGCVRVQKPFDLAFFCMSATSNDVYKDRLYYSLEKPPLSNAGKKLAKENKLKKLPDILNPEDKISLFIDYFTVYKQPCDSMLYYADDTYGYDDLILDALNPNKPKKETTKQIAK